MEAVKNKGNLEHASNILQNNFDIVLEAVKSDGINLARSPKEFKNNFDIVYEAVKNNGFSLLHTNEFKNNFDIVYQAVNNQGYSLKYASDDLKNNIEIVSLAISKNGKYLEFASTKLQGNYEIVYEAVKNNGYSLKFASKELQNNFDIVNTAIQSYKNINLENPVYKFDSDKNFLSHASKNLQKNNYLIFQIISIFKPPLEINWKFSQNIYLRSDYYKLKFNYFKCFNDGIGHFLFNFLFFDLVLIYSFQ
jgi:hypothetical protein